MKEKIETEVEIYQQAMNVKAIKCKRISTAQTMQQSLSTLYSLQQEHLKVLKEQTEISRKAHEATEKERSEKLSESRREDDAKEQLPFPELNSNWKQLFLMLLT